MQSEYANKFTGGILNAPGIVIYLYLSISLVESELEVYNRLGYSDPPAGFPASGGNRGKATSIYLGGNCPDSNCAN